MLTVVIRLPALSHPQTIDDEAVYSVVANEIVDGGRPYIDAVERKPPVLFWTYAAIFKIAGNYNWPALHALSLIWRMGTMAGLYVIGRRMQLLAALVLLGAPYYASDWRYRIPSCPPPELGA